MIRPIRMLPLALTAAFGAYALVAFIGASSLYAALAGAVAGGWLLGRLTRTQTS